MRTQPLRLRVLALAAGLALIAFSGWASADPPSRVARVGYMTGAVSFSPAGEDDWVRAGVNRPLTTGDRLWTDDGARAEIQVGGAMIRLGAGTGLSVLNLDDRIAQLQLTQGTLNVNVRRLGRGQSFEVDTPNLAFTLRQPGAYRIDVDPDGNATTIVVRQGQGEAYGEDASYVVDSRQPYRFYGTGLREYDVVDAPRSDDFDRWAGDRDHAYDNSGSARYVSPDVVGYQDLDANGSWRVDATYGNVWTPNRVAAGWAPYRDGHWAWVDPWGWTWVDDAPWGFAVSHYGRWANFGGSWGWVPGPVRTPAYYAPALVVFVGGANFQLAVSSGNVGGIGWFPLAPREVYRPSYPVSRGYFENINRSNTVVNTTVINNTYNNTNVTNIVYANRQVPGAVVAVPTTTFVQSQPVSRAAVRVTQTMVASAPVALIPQATPTERSVRGAAAAGDKPPPRVFERPVVARTAPPAASIGFAAQQPQLAAKPGQPLDDAARKALKPSAAAPAPVVKVVAPVQAAAPKERPPAVAPAARTDEGRAKSDERKAPAAPVAPAASVAPPQRPLPPQATPPAAATPAPEQRGRGEPPGRAGQRGEPVATPPAQTPRTAEPTTVTPQATPPAPAAQQAEQRGKAEARGNAEPRGQAAAPPPAPPQRAPEAKAVTPPQAAPPVPSAQPVEPRGKPEPRAQPVAPPPAPTPRAPEPKAVTPQTPPPAPAAQPAEPRGQAEQRGRTESRGQAAAPPPAPPQRAAEPKAAPPPVAPPVQAPPKVAPPPPVAPAAPPPAPRAKPEPAPAPAAQPPAQRAKPEPAPAAKQAEPRPPAAAPKAPPPQAEPASQAQSRSKERKPAAGKPDDKKKDGEQ